MARKKTKPLTSRKDRESYPYMEKHSRMTSHTCFYYKQFDDLKLLKAFVKLMMKEKTKAALLLITKQDRDGISHINNIIHNSELSTPYTVLDTLNINNLKVNLLIN